MTENGNGQSRLIRSIFVVLLTAILGMAGWLTGKVNEIDGEIHELIVIDRQFGEDIRELHRQVRYLEIYTYPQHQTPPD